MIFSHFGYIIVKLYYIICAVLIVPILLNDIYKLFKNIICRSLHLAPILSMVNKPQWSCTAQYSIFACVKLLSPSMVRKTKKRKLHFFFGQREVPQQYIKMFRLPQCTAPSVHPPQAADALDSDKASNPNSPSSFITSVLFCDPLQLAI